MTLSGDDEDADAPRPAGEPSRGRILFAGGAWSALGQLLPAAVALVLTPYIIHGFGVERYGLYVLCTTFIAFLTSFDGGLGNSVARYLAVYAGVGDDRSAARLLTSVIAVLIAAGAVASVLVFFGARSISYAFGMSAALRGEAVFLIRTLVVLAVLGLLQGLLAVALQVRGRYAVPQTLAVGAYGAYTLGVIVSVQGHYGLRGLALTLVVQQSCAVLPMAVPVFRALDFRHFRFLTRAEFREFISFAGRVQLVGLSTLFAVEVDAVLIGAALSVRDVGLYAAGASLASQLRSLPTNVLRPLSVVLGRAFGRGGDDELRSEFTRLQRGWVIGSSLWSVTAAAAAWFALTSWLGNDFGLSGDVTVVIVLGAMPSLWASATTSLVTIAGLPGIDARYSFFAVLVNVAFTVPLIYVSGVLGVVAGTAIGNAVAAVYLVRLTRRRYHPGLASFFREVPSFACMVAAAVTLVLEIAVRPISPHGPAGLLFCALPAAVGLLSGTVCHPMGRDLLRVGFRLCALGRNATAKLPA